MLVSCHYICLDLLKPSRFVTRHKKAASIYL
uniref:Uncharacterized protein n=1 Tax=Rhizophora mucronata TaxID=61149 RepID=A0A2P2P948_RHIMU